MIEKTWIGVFAILPMGALACSSNNGGGGGQAGTITLSAQFAQGPVALPVLLPGRGNPTAFQQAPPPLAGYNCIVTTVTSPPVSAMGTSDANGKVQVSIAASGLPCNCTITNNMGMPVGPIIFKSGNQTSQLVTISGNADLGVVTVDPSQGIALADAPPTVMITNTPPGAPCPLGHWSIQTWPMVASCGNKPQVADTEVTQTSTGGYQVSFTHGPEDHNNNGVPSCTYSSQTNVPATWSNGSLSFTFPQDKGGGGGGTGGSGGTGGTGSKGDITIVLTPDSQCKMGSSTATFTGCGACPNGPDYCNNQGTMMCTAVWPSTRVF